MIKSTKPIEQQTITAFEALIQSINESSTDYLELDHLVHTIDTKNVRGNSYTTRHTISGYLRKLELIGFLNKVENSQCNYVRNCEIPVGVLRSSRADDYLVVKQEFDETSECKTGWELAYQETMNNERGENILDTIDQFEVIEHIETDKFYNPTIVLFQTRKSIS